MIEDLKFFAEASQSEIFKKLSTSKDGLSDNESKNRLIKYGPNRISEKKEVSIVVEFLSHFKSPLTIILLSAAAISAYLGEIKNFIVITVIVLASVILDFFEEHSANNAAKKLKEKVNITATVIRDGIKIEIPSFQICPGDIIFLSAGDLVPADARIIEADDFFINQSALTGESFPREKFPELLKDQPNIENNDTVIFLGSNVISGTALAVVFYTGQSTMFGGIARNVLKKEDKSNFELGIANFGFFIMKVILIMSLFIFLANALMNGDTLQSFIFAVAIAVGVTPELLPVIMSVTMARGSQRMAKAGVIVKKLSAIPNFGSMDILCTDKTGTLTEDKIRLEQYTDIGGKLDESVFRNMYLNSIFQTGVKNPFDKAVEDYKQIDIAAYKKIEEIPFDFARKMGTIVVNGPQGSKLITRGAPEEVIKNCNFYQNNNEVVPLTQQKRKLAIDYFRQLSSEGYRVLSIATKSHLHLKDKYTIDDESDLVFNGFVSFIDSAKKDVSQVLKDLHSYGVTVKIITGDNELVTQKICRDVGLEIKSVLMGSECDTLTDDALVVRAENTTIFARFSPNQKNRVIQALRSNGHVVGYLGDGINDAPSLKTADIGISVDNGADIAKETADIILTNKHLQSIIDGVIEGRRTFGNTMKYVMMGLSSNFGNMFSVLGAIFYLPFLPMLPIQILLNNFIYDFSQITIPTDKVDANWIDKPRRWNIEQVKRFMLIFGPISSICDFLTFFVLFSVFHLSESAFQTGWFLESLATQILVIHVIRTKQIPFLQSRASKFLTFSTIAAVCVGWIIPYTPLGAIFKFSPLPLPALLSIIGLVITYLISIEIVKRFYYRKYNF